MNFLHCFNISVENRGKIGHTTRYGSVKIGLQMKERRDTVASKKKGFTKEHVLERLWRIAEDARKATWVEKTDKNGETAVEYDTKCASIELKAIEFAVKLSGLSEQSAETVTVSLGDDVKELAI